MVKIRALWLAVDASYWFWPALLSIGAVLLSIATVHIDRTMDMPWLGDVGWITLAQPDSARNILNVIAASMITVASTVFSITIAAVAYASGSYGPRLLNNFMEDKGNLLSLATFIATFTYAVMILRVVRSAGEEAGASAADLPGNYEGFVPQISILVATVLMAVAVAVLVYFLHHIPASIRISTVLDGIAQRLLKDIERRFPENGEDSDTPPWPPGATVGAQRSGYIRLIDYGTLDRIAREQDCRIVLKCRTGEFIQRAMPLIEVVDRTADDAMTDDLLGAFSWGAMRSGDQDLEYLLDELVEIALRALSPGINDPFTALTAMYWLSAATGEFAARALHNGPDHDEYDAGRVRPCRDDFAHFLSRGMGAMRHAAATSPIVADAFYDCLTAIVDVACNDKRRSALAAEGAAMMEQARAALTGPSLARVEERYGTFRLRVEDAAAA